MKESKKFFCDNCDHPAKDTDKYCNNCGEVFDENLLCINHKSSKADGVCVICRVPFCDICLGRIKNYFLCTEHSHYEIYEGMARIFGTSDYALAEYICDSLEKAEFHPYNYSRKVSPISMGGPDYSLYRASGEYNGHLINEFKIMVPCSEVLNAEKLLKDLNP